MTVGNMQEGKLIEKRNLPNQLSLLLYDQSRLVAADRWLIRLCGEAQVRLNPRYWDQVQEQDLDLLAAIRSRMGEVLTLRINKERNFINAEEKETVLSELVGQIHRNMLAYFEHPHFALKLFRRQYAERKRQYLMEIEMARHAAARDREDDGPADFSCLFRD